MTARRVVIATSGIGNRFGGIGVVAELMVQAFAPFGDVRVVQHRAELPRVTRIARFGAELLRAAWSAPALVFYDHIDLAAIHGMIPTLRRVPFGIFLHGTDIWRPVVGQRRRAAESASVLVANSAFTLADGRATNPWFPPADVVHLGVPASALRPEGAPGEEPLALIVGRMHSGERRKGHDPILDAWPKIRAAVPDAKLVMAGDGDDIARLRARVRDEDLAGVEITGRVDDAARDRLYQRARLFLFPSTQEGFGLAAIEAAAAGLPVLAVRNTVLEEVLPDGAGGVFATTQTGDAIAEAAIPLLADRARATAVGAAGRDLVRSRYLEQHFIARFRAAVGARLQTFATLTADATPAGR